MKTPKVQWRKTPKGLVPHVDGVEVVWAPQPGAQESFLSCPVFEVLLTGPRGSGKTDALLFDFAQHVGQGFGAEWRGILFRQTYPQLADIVAKTKKWFPRIFPQVVFNEAKMQWTWPTGETLRLSYMEREEDYYNHHGSSYPFIAWEELTTWPSDKCYRTMMSCSRSTKVGMPRKYRATTNPYGPGMNWVKARFRLPVPPGRVAGPIIKDENGLSRVAIHAPLTENLVLNSAEPSYRAKIEAAARNPAERKAWLEGSWDIVAGGMFDDLWRPAIHVLPNIPLKDLPTTWRLNRSYDHGQSKPFAVLWWAESNGEPMEIEDRKIGTVRGDLILIAEWYGWNGSPNEGLRLLAVEIAQGIVDRQREWGIHERVHRGVADSSIFDAYEPGKSVAGDMAKKGVFWDPADKRPGSRKQGWEQLRKLLSGAIPGKEGIREAPGIFICRRCEEFLRTVPVLPRSTKDPDDVDTNSEDHQGDAARYRVRERNRRAGIVDWT